uniref:Uncharacterized protein n=1 Tax=Labrus bergylta TaxID=56723 RepID=A0A3Q3F5V9_9LABR
VLIYLEEDTSCKGKKKLRRLDKARGQTRVNIGTAFPRWRHLKEAKGLQSDAMVALFLLDRCVLLGGVCSPSRGFSLTGKC